MHFTVYKMRRKGVAIEKRRLPFEHCMSGNLLIADRRDNPLRRVSRTAQLYSMDQQPQLLRVLFDVQVSWVGHTGMVISGIEFDEVETGAVAFAQSWRCLAGIDAKLGGGDEDVYSNGAPHSNGRKR